MPQAVDEVDSRWQAQLRKLSDVIRSGVKLADRDRDKHIGPHEWTAHSMRIGMCAHKIYGYWRVRIVVRPVNTSSEAQGFTVDWREKARPGSRKASPKRKRNR